MHLSNVQAVELVFLLLLLFVAAFGVLACRLKVPYPIVLVIGGGLLGFLPVFPSIRLNPDVVFFVVLPPLLYSAAWSCSWRDFRYHFVSIFLLAVGLVAFTTVGVSVGAPWLFPGFDWRLGLILGAVIAPTDAIAATSIAERIHLPRRIRDILEGESLINDATGLLALEFGIAILVRGITPTVAGGVGRFVYLIVVGLAIGFAVAWIVDHIERRIDDGPIEIAFSFLIPYAAYFTADRLRASGVLAVVTCGLYLSRKSSRFYSPTVRLQMYAIWEALTFILNGLVFVLIGLQLPNVLAGIRSYGRTNLILVGILFSLLVIALRMIWVFPGAQFAYWIRTRILHQNYARPRFGGTLILGWTGMRGVIALAAAIALPNTLADGSPFPHRNLIIYLAFYVIFVTLILQGLTLPWLVRVLSVSEKGKVNTEEVEARREILQTALAYLERSRHESEEEYEELYEDLAGHYRMRLNAAVGPDGAGEPNVNPKHHHRLGELLQELLQVERETALQLREEGRINDEVLRQLEYELDLREAGPTQMA